MTDFDRASWEQRWAQVLRDHGDLLASRPPSTHLIGEVGDLPPGRALDAGCGHGAETLWLAAARWRVTAVDFSTAALAHGRATAEALGVADRVDWVEADLGSWTPSPEGFDLVSCLYVHVAGAVDEFVRRLASGVRPGGNLLLVGHLPIDPQTGAPTPAAGQVQVDVEQARRALDHRDWEIVVAEERRRPQAGSGVDAVVRAVRRPSFPSPS